MLRTLPLAFAGTCGVSLQGFEALLLICPCIGRPEILLPLDMIKDRGFKLRQSIVRYRARKPFSLDRGPLLSFSWSGFRWSWGQVWSLCNNLTLINILILSLGSIGILWSYKHLIHRTIHWGLLLWAVLEQKKHYLHHRRDQVPDVLPLRRIWHLMNVMEFFVAILHTFQVRWNGNAQHKEKLSHVSRPTASDIGRTNASTTISRLCYERWIWSVRWSSYSTTRFSTTSWRWLWTECRFQSE
jgi:hypothetical protein